MNEATFSSMRFGQNSAIPSDYRYSDWDLPGRVNEVQGLAGGVGPGRHDVSPPSLALDRQASNAGPPERPGPVDDIQSPPRQKLASQSPRCGAAELWGCHRRSQC